MFFYFVVLSLTAFAFLQSFFTWKTFRKTFPVKPFWMWGYASYFAAASVLLAGSIPAAFRITANTVILLGSWFQFLGFLSFYNKRLRNIGLCAAGMMFILDVLEIIFTGHMVVCSLIMLLSVPVLILFAYFSILRDIPPQQKKFLTISLVFIFCICVLLSGEIAMLLLKGDRLDYSIVSRRIPGLGMIFVSLLLCAQNQIADERLRARLEKNITELHENQQELKEKNHELLEMNNNIVDVVAASLEMKLSETSNHVKRVSEFTRVILNHLHYTGKDFEMIVSAAALHDIGKIGIPDELLATPGKITVAEMQVMQKHTLYGYEILGKTDSPFLKIAARIALEHHENWDGTGYPLHKKGTEINFSSRVVSVADTFDALVQKRCYKEAWDFNDAIAYVIGNSGKKFDPDIITILPECSGEFIEILERQKPCDSGEVMTSYTDLLFSK